MKSLNVSTIRWFVTGGILLSATLLGHPCLAGVSIGEIYGPFSCDPEGDRPQGEYTPCWSPDGTKIAFSWGNGYTAQGNPQGSYICIITAGGECIRGPDNPLVNDPYWDNHSPDWSSNGNWIVYNGTKVGPAYIAKISLIDEEVVPITEISGNWHPRNPKWSPDGTKIAYRGGYWHGTYHIWLTDVNGSNHEDLTPGITGSVVGLSWRPDGSEIIFTQPGMSSLFVVEVATGIISELPGFADSGLFPNAVVWDSEGDSILFDIDAASEGIYCYQISTQQTTQLTYGPDYPGYEGPAYDHLGDWHPTAGLVFWSNRGCTVRWDSNIYTAAPAPTPVEIDIKPGSCPNPLNVARKGMLPVAILGSEDFDVTTIDIAPIRLAGVAPIRSSYEDVSRPVPVTDANECACTTAVADGYTDLTLKFKTREIVGALVAAEVDFIDGEELTLTLTGALTDETPIEGADCMVVVGQVPRSIHAKRSDINGDGVVNMLDVAMVADNWLESSVVED